MVGGLPSHHEPRPPSSTSLAVCPPSPPTHTTRSAPRRSLTHRAPTSTTTPASSPTTSTRPSTCGRARRQRCRPARRSACRPRTCTSARGRTCARMRCGCVGCQEESARACVCVCMCVCKGCVRVIKLQSARGRTCARVWAPRVTHPTHLVPPRRLFLWAAPPPRWLRASRRVRRGGGCRTCACLLRSLSWRKGERGVLGSWLRVRLGGRGGARTPAARLTEGSALGSWQGCGGGQLTEGSELGSWQGCGVACLADRLQPHPMSIRGMRLPARTAHCALGVCSPLHLPCSRKG